MLQPTKLKKIGIYLIPLTLTGVFIFLPFKVPSQGKGKQAVKSQANVSTNASTTPATTLAKDTETQIQNQRNPAEPPQAPRTAVSAAGQFPVLIKIASINLTAPVVKTGLEDDGSLHVPSSPDQSGWYMLGTKPGDIGPAVITGHYDSKFGPGVFYNLHKVKTGNEIRIVRDDGSTAIFSVTKSETYPQDDFNTQAVYSPISEAGLRIITCAGTYNKQTGHYSDDLVVYATLRQIIEPGKFMPQ